jgi:alanine-glyoxylate transaminase/serine-glyoxylate transaminase/serine-pyruvate transaminase
MAFNELIPPDRLLLGPGPSNVHPRVLKVLMSPLVGYMDPFYLQVMDETQALLKYVFKTKNKFTFLVPGSGMAGMEAALCNIVEPGDDVIVCVAGLFGERMSNIVLRIGGQPIRVDVEWGKIITKDSVEAALKESNAKVIAIVHGETSTGIQQPINELGTLAKSYDALLLVDAVTSLGGCELEIDAWDVDICYSGSQKCLNCPPGLAPITLNDRTLNTIQNRKTPIQSFYLDLKLINKYWSEERIYHHTGAISMTYAVREALRIIHEEGLENRVMNHRRNSQAFIKGIEAMGLEMHAQVDYRLPSLNTVVIPKEVNDVNVRRMLLNVFNTEIGGGLGMLKGKIWSVGLMGLNSSEKNVIFLLEALERTLRKEGYPVKPSSGIGAAIDFYHSVEK